MRGAAAAEEAKAKVKAQMTKQAAEEMPRADEQRSGKQRQVMLGKDGRPLSPLSAAHARAKMGLDPYDEDPELRPSDIVPCPCCGRNFASDRLEVRPENRRAA